MYQFIKKNAEKNILIILASFITIILMLVLISFKNNSKVDSKIELGSIKDNKELSLIKKFLFSKINSPFFNVNYEVKKGDTIQKILNSYKIPDNQIQEIINQYKKYDKPKQLSAGGKIDIIIERGFKKSSNSILKFSIPITKSTTIEITKDELGQISSKKIITKLFKKKTYAENIILNNLYSAATEAKIYPDTIIEFARIFGFEIDFQRDIRKND